MRHNSGSTRSLGKTLYSTSCDSAERATQRAAPLEHHVPTPHCTQEWSPTATARDPRDPAEGAWWQQGKQVWLERNTTFQCYLWSISRGSTGHLRDLTSDTCPLQRIQLTAWGGLACQSPPSAGYKDQSSKCHSSSAVSPCLSRVRSYRVSSQPLETHRDCALNGRPQADVCQNTKGNPGKSSPVPGRSPAHPCTSPTSSHEPVAAVGQLSQGHSRGSPCSQPGPVPQAAVTISLLTPQPRWKHRQEQRHLLPREGRGCEQGHARNSRCRGDKAAMVPTQRSSCCGSSSLDVAALSTCPTRLRLAGRLRDRGGIRASCGGRGKAAGKISSAAMP